MRTPTQADLQIYTGLHCHRLWASVGERYTCPSCDRTKFELLRWTLIYRNKPRQRKGWKAILHRHHDHSDNSMSRQNARFRETVICDQCNASDGTAKRILGLPKNFSFSPDEIKQFVRAAPHVKHEIDYDVAQAIYENIGSENKFLI